MQSKIEQGSWPISICLTIGFVLYGLAGRPSKDDPEPVPAAVVRAPKTSLKEEYKIHYQAARDAVYEVERNEFRERVRRGKERFEAKYGTVETGANAALKRHTGR
jgi:hypothetical protein